MQLHGGFLRSYRFAKERQIDFAIIPSIEID